MIWLIAFVILFAIFPLRENNRPLFEAIMPVVLSLVTSFFTPKIFKKLDTNFVKKGWLSGIIVTVINWIIDAFPMLSPSPMQMSLSDYIQNIGVAYFMILPKTAAIGYLFIL